MGIPWTLHPAGDAPAPTFLVLPGGAYGVIAPHEGQPVASWLNTLGFHAAVLHYTTGERCWPEPLHEARAALAALRTGDVPLAVDRDRVAVLGFSAGGHLAGLLATDSRDVSGTDPQTYAGRPDLAVLCYPVTELRERMEDGGINGHTGSSDNLLGPGAPAELRQELSIPRRVGVVQGSLPLVFLWTTSDDDRVPPAHSLSLLSGLSAAGADTEAHVFRFGRHGLGLAEAEPEVAQWTTLAARWFGSLGWR